MIVRSSILIKKSEIGKLWYLIKKSKGIITKIGNIGIDLIKVSIIIPYSKICEKIANFDEYPVTIFKYNENNEEKAICF